VEAKAEAEAQAHEKSRRRIRKARPSTRHALIGLNISSASALRKLSFPGIGEDWQYPAESKEVGSRYRASEKIGLCIGAAKDHLQPSGTRF
jgi:hypothetical protein